MVDRSREQRAKLRVMGAPFLPVSQRADRQAGKHHRHGAASGRVRRRDRGRGCGLGRPGSGSAAAVQLATLSTGLNLTNNDIVVNA